MKRFRWQPCAVAALFSLVVAATAQAQYTYSQPIYSQPSYSYSYSQPSYLSGYTSYGYSQPTYSSYSQPYYYGDYGFSPAYTYSLNQPTYAPGYGYTQPDTGTRLTYSGYSGYTRPAYSYAYSRPYGSISSPDWSSNPSYTLQPVYSRGYSGTQPYYFPGQGSGTMTVGVMPNGVSYRSWQPPSRIRNY